MQNMGVSRMQRQSKSVIPDASSEGLLSVRALRVHHAHLSSGQGENSGCGICRQGLAGAMEKTPTARKKLPVVEGSGVDKKDDSASPSSGGDDKTESGDGVSW